METSSIERNIGRTAVAKGKSEAAIEASPFWTTMEDNRFGIISMFLIVIGCMGGFAAAFTAGDNIPMFALVTFSTIVAEAMVLAVTPMKVIALTGVVAVLIDIIAMFV